MRIALDYLPAMAHAPGVGRYVRELVRALLGMPDGPALDLLQIGRARPLWSAEELHLADGGARVRLVRRAWPRRALGLLAALGKRAESLAPGSALVHQARLPPLPVRSRPQSIALAELPAEGSRADAELAALLARGAGAFVFSSELERRLRARHAVAAGRVRRVPVGCEHWRRELCELPGPARPARIVVLGRRTADRAPLAVLAALERLRARGLEAELVWPAAAGGTPDAVEPAFRAALERSDARAAVQLGPAGGLAGDPRRDEEALPALVGGASVLLHLVADAGTPVTPLEAAALGVPVVARRLPAFEEALGAPELARTGAVAWLDPGAPDDGAFPETLADALARALAARASPAARDALLAAARPFTWEACARATLAGWRAWTGADVSASGR
jgi:glycosyltransferase involved in cell wall biosynthesis